MPRRVAFLIGNQDFKPESGLSPLHGPSNDIAALARLLRDPKRGNFEVHEFLDQPGYQVLPEIERALRAASLHDLVLIFYSGHGKLGRNGRLFLATADTDEDTLLTSSISTRHLKDLVEETDCGQVILLLDCCYSGAVGARGDVSSELRLINDAQGFFIITATNSTKPARETELAPGGAVMGRFTAALVNGIETGAADSEYRGEVRFSDLRRYLGHAVTGQTPQFYDIRASGDPLISFSPATAAALLDPEVLADLDAAQWHRRRGAVAALFDVLRDGNAAARAAAKAALERRLTQERDYLVRAEVESALHLESVASPQVGSPIAPVLAAALEEDEPSAEQPSDFDPEAARTMILSGNAPPSSWRPWITVLKFAGTALTSLDPLAGLTALQVLDLCDTKVSDVAPLAGLTGLTNLNLHLNKITDVAPLAGLTALEVLDLGFSEVRNIRPLARLKKLKELNLESTHVIDLKPLAGLTSLKDLNLHYTSGVSDVGPLAGLTTLRTLNLNGTNVSDVTLLAGLTALRTLDLNGTQLRDVIPLAGLTGLQHLNLRHTRVIDVAPLAGLTALETLDLSHTDVADVAPLASLTALRTLFLTRDADFTGMSDADWSAVTSSDFDTNKVKDVSPLLHIQGLQIFGGPSRQ